MRVMLCGGGTGGHIYPALSIVNALKEANSDVEVLYIGTENGLESEIVAKASIPFKSIEVSGFRRKLSFDNVKSVIRFLTAKKLSKKYIREFRPDVVIGTGGYVCAPVVYAAAKLGVPTVIHEQNSLPGITNKFLARFVDCVLICFADAGKYFSDVRVVLTGNPRASEVVNTLRLGKTAMGLSAGKKTVLISGGSRGAKPINDAFVARIAEYERADFEVVFVTGDVHYDDICGQIAGLGEFRNVSVRPFIDDMPKFLVNVDLFVGRSGATFLSEITALGVPSVLIPSPYVTENHQEFNARSVTDHGGGVLILERDLNGERLFDEISRVMSDDSMLRSMQDATKKLGIPDATKRILDVIDELVK